MYLRNGPEHGGSQTIPQYNPPVSETESQLWSRKAPNVPGYGRSALSPHTSDARFQEDPATRVYINLEHFIIVYMLAFASCLDTTRKSVSNQLEI